MTDYGITYDGTGYLSSYGRFAYGPNLIVIHSLECNAVPHIAEQLSARGGYLDNEGLAPQRMTDPVSIVKTIPDGHQGGHIGSPGNSHCAGVEVSGRAAWTRSQWMDGGNAQKALDQQARAVAGLAVVYGWGYEDLRWLKIAQVKAGERGLCTHNDISLSGISRTNHWDPGTGYPFDWVLSRVRYWFQVMTGGLSIIDDEDAWLDMGAKEDILGAIAAIGAQVNMLYQSEVIRDDTGKVSQGYTRTAANFNDVRELAAASKVTADQVADMAENEDIPGQPFNKTAANFNDVRGYGDSISAALAAMTVQITALQGAVAQITGIPVVHPTHTVVAGDTVSKIATQHGVTVANLVTWNSLANPDTITEGQILKLSGE